MSENESPKPVGRWHRVLLFVAVAILIINFLIGIGVLGGSTLAWLLGIPGSIIWIFAVATLVGGIGLVRRWRIAYILLLLLIPWGVDLLSRAEYGRSIADVPLARNWELQFFVGYELQFLQAEVDGSSSAIRATKGSTTKGNPFVARDLGGYVSDTRYGFHLDVVNFRDDDITVHWPDARYMDELGDEHELFESRTGLPDVRDGLTVSAPSTMAPREKMDFLVVPLYKQKTIKDAHGRLFPKSEYLVPTNLEELDESQAKRRLAELAELATPVTLRVPIEIEGKTHEYQFQFVLQGKTYREPTEAEAEAEESVQSELERRIMEAS